MYQMRKGIGNRSAHLLTILAMKGKNIFTIQEADHLLSGNKNNIRNMLHNLVNKGWLQRLERGRYLILPLESERESEYPQSIIASRLVNPYYISYHSALAYYGYLKKRPRTLFIATTKRKKDLSINGCEYRFVTLPQNKFFGFKKVQLDGQSINMARKEKTILDCLDHLDLCGGIEEVARALQESQKELSFTKLREYALRMGNRAVIQRLGYLMELYSIGSFSDRERLRKGISKSYTLLDNTGPWRGRYIERWKVRVNVNLERDMVQGLGMGKSNLLEEFNREEMRKEKYSYREALKIFELLHQEVLSLGTLKSSDPLEGIETDTRLAKILSGLSK